MTKPGKRVVKAGLTKNKPLSHRREPYESDNGVYIYIKKILRTTPNMENWKCKGPEVNKRFGHVQGR